MGNGLKPAHETLVDALELNVEGCSLSSPPKDHLWWGRILEDCALIKRTEFPETELRGMILRIRRILATLEAHRPNSTTKENISKVIADLELRLQS